MAEEQHREQASDIETLLNEYRAGFTFPPTPDVASHVRDRLTDKRLKKQPAQRRAKYIAIRMRGNHGADLGVIREPQQSVLFATQRHDRPHMLTLLQTVGAGVMAVVVGLVLAAVFRHTPADSSEVTGILAHDVPLIATCPTTSSAPTAPFGFGDDPVHRVWYRQHDLWASPASFSAVNPTLSDGPSAWYAGPLPVRWKSDRDTITSIVGHRRDDATTLLDVHLTALGHRDPSVKDSVLTFPDAGCWEITVTAGRNETTLIVDVLPEEARPDVIAAQAAQLEARPYAIPPSCAASTWDIEDRMGRMHAAFWAGNDQMSASIASPGLLFQGANNRIDWRLADLTTLQVTGISHDGATGEVTIEWSRTADRFGEHPVTTITFPASGCWTLRAESPDASLDLVVYVYPAP